MPYFLIQNTQGITRIKPRKFLLFLINYFFNFYLVTKVEVVNNKQTGATELKFLKKVMTP
tara:strand:+ start:530 stop:709 length:180 start_codon:yes stop_codon:yes gene_type:complete